MFAWPSALYASVTITSFIAQISNDVVQINWDTEFELDQLGYRVWRTTESASQFEAIGSKVLVTDGLIAATGSGRYSATDGTIEAGITYYYWLESVGRAADDVAFDGPRSVRLGGSAGVALAAPPTTAPTPTTSPTEQPLNTAAPTAPPEVNQPDVVPTAAPDVVESVAPVATQEAVSTSIDEPEPAAEPVAQSPATVIDTAPTAVAETNTSTEQPVTAESEPQTDAQQAQVPVADGALVSTAEAPAAQASAQEAPSVTATAIVAVEDNAGVSAESTAPEISQPIASSDTATVADVSESAADSNTASSAPPNPIGGDAIDGQPLRIEETRDRFGSQWLWLGLLGSILLVVGSGAAIVLLRRSH